ncbi:zinc dependent phospholipase C family protein [Camelliibacillus cellulosilyticus]|uniref:Zinc dependent phospholipase C family protein n=1 Tax=Camelliibacillus cellulosilyticus TaxID=2174486 RepID=A0ABV9GLN9_9BACL
MPNVWTHIDFAERVLAELGCLPSQQRLRTYLRLGAQGPDPFFYHRFWPWVKEKPAAAVGDKIHDEACGSFLMDMIERGAKEEENDALRWYILGFITHHLLDRNAHPYINYRSGPEGAKHQELEFTIDTLWMAEKRQLKTWRVSVYKEIDVGAHLDASICVLLEDLVAKHFPDLASKMPEGYVDESYRDMVRALRFLQKFAGRKSRWLPADISALVFKPIDSDVDFLNRKRTLWFDPTNNDVSFNNSFDDLFEQAKREALEIVPNVLQYWETANLEMLSVIREQLGNISYSTGKDCALGLKNLYYDPIL